MLGLVQRMLQHGTHCSTHHLGHLLLHFLPHCLSRPPGQAGLRVTHAPLQRLSRATAAKVAMVAALALSACSHAPLSRQDALDLTLAQLLPTQVLMLGEQHDAPEHQAIHERTVRTLAARGQLAAMVLEMANGGSTAGLAATASEAQAQEALQWDPRAWPWPAYGPAVMAAVRAGVPVLGGNLPTARMRASMGQTELDLRLSPQALARQQTLIREGHCQLLPESQIGPMTRVQIARDVQMAQTIASALPLARPGQVVLLISGSVHADRQLGVPVHLPAGIKVSSLRLQAGSSAMAGERFDQVLSTPAAPKKDYCTGLAEQFKHKAAPGSK